MCSWKCGGVSLSFTALYHPKTFLSEIQLNCSWVAQVGVFRGFSTFYLLSHLALRPCECRGVHSGSPVACCSNSPREGHVAIRGRAIHHEFPGKYQAHTAARRLLLTVPFSNGPGKCRFPIPLLYLFVVNLGQGISNKYNLQGNRVCEWLFGLGLQLCHWGTAGLIPPPLVLINITVKSCCYLTAGEIITSRSTAVGGTYCVTCSLRGALWRISLHLRDAVCNYAQFCKPYISDRPSPVASPAGIWLAQDSLSCCEGLTVPAREMWAEGIWVKKAWCTCLCFGMTQCPLVLLFWDVFYHSQRLKQEEEDRLFKTLWKGRCPMLWLILSKEASLIASVLHLWADSFLSLRDRNFAWCL